MVSGFSKTQQYVFLFFLDNMFRPIGYHQVIFTKQNKKYVVQSHITWMLFVVPYHMNAICSPVSHECYL